MIKVGNLFASFKDIKIIPGHGGSSHCLWWSTCCSPLWRLLFCRPKPHVTLQALHSDHSDHSPSTAIQYGVLRFNIFCYLYLMPHKTKTPFMITMFYYLREESTQLYSTNLHPCHGNNIHLCPVAWRNRMCWECLVVVDVL